MGLRRILHQQYVVSRNTSITHMRGIQHMKQPIADTVFEVTIGLCLLAMFAVVVYVTFFVPVVVR